MVGDAAAVPTLASNVGLAKTRPTGPTGPFAPALYSTERVHTLNAFTLTSALLVACM